MLPYIFDLLPLPTCLGPMMMLKLPIFAFSLLPFLVNISE